MNILRYEDIKIGSEYSFSRTVSAKDVKIFSKLTGDTNPLHSDILYARDTKFKKPIIHGMLVASLFSRLIGTYCPGKYALYISQELKFNTPIYFGTEVEVYGKVVSKMDALKIITLQTRIRNAANGAVLISGKAMVQVLL